MWLQWSQRLQTSSVAKRSRGGRKLRRTEALALVLGYFWSSWDHYYRLSGSGVKYFKDLFLHRWVRRPCLYCVVWTIRTRSTILRGPLYKVGFILSSNFGEYVWIGRRTIQARVISLLLAHLWAFCSGAFGSSELKHILKLMILIAEK